jgi:diguanylate cyclase (GGDEF)-like protein
MRDVEDFRAFVVRHRVKIFDLGFIVAILAAATLFAFEVDVFENESRFTQHQETIELDEVFVLTSLAIGGMLFYTWRRAREHQRENTRRLAAEHEIMVLAMQDPLTGLPNRRQFDTALKAALNTPPPASEAHAVLLLDLNGFKKINDIHGHPVGDQVLINVAARLLRAVREGDLVARLGGDEFIVLARNVDGPEGATNIGLRIIESLTAPVSIDGVQHSVGAGIGVALSPQNGLSADEMLRKADVALYRAKTARKSTLRFFEPQMDARLNERDGMERALLDGMEKDQFRLSFQPDRMTGARVTGFEVMSRWPHPVLGELEPERFLPIAEEAGLLARLTEQLLTKACVEAGAWPDDVRLSFKLPSPLLNEIGFGAAILAVLEQTGLAPRRLALEIDEGALIRNAEAAQALIAPLRVVGASVIADHFGTGYSDLQNLRRLELDGVKIDPSYIAAMLHDRQAAVMVKALIGVSHGLNLSVTANGVRTKQQKAALAAQGCEQGQGALYGQPLSAEAALALAHASDVMDATEQPGRETVK